MGCDKDRTPQNLFDRATGTRATHMGCDEAFFMATKKELTTGTRATHMGCDVAYCSAAAQGANGHSRHPHGVRLFSYPQDEGY